ncbi:hypothetical protein TSOC_013031 [Tetrabaena socialis]|uniref:Uncharacterized protein n=1 Tax=Tetrabaena socialis TaxID=47790 RepID=A0A2J7ZLF5_9CHLO|nr:hypothetical protein TSOC_013031 [Tetrabaena socialis]|eukprot:PNH01096.1 hypothetical protein TSOC_013031 [Tetrabaena socialis]
MEPSKYARVTMANFEFDELPGFKNDVNAAFSKLRGRLRLSELEVPVREAYLMLNGFPVAGSSMEVWWLGIKDSIIRLATVWHDNNQRDEGVAEADRKPLEGDALVRYYQHELDLYFAEDRKLAKHLEFKMLTHSKSSPSLFLKRLKLLEKDLNGSVLCHNLP